MPTPPHPSGIDPPIRPAVKMYSPSPVHPQDGTARLPGTVELRAIVTARGTVCGVTVRRSLSPSYDAAAIEAVERWTFRPVTVDGVGPVSSWLDLTVRFTPGASDQTRPDA
jgi:TonB family protein